MKRLYRVWKTPGNQGFSLVELIISITILVLIMLPIMNSFYRSAQMNKKAENIQEQSNIAASIMEGLRNLNIDQTIDQFNGADPFDIIMDASGYEGLTYNSVTGKYTEIDYNTLGKQATYYFAIYGIDAGGTAYDALITMNSGTYKTGSILNNYPMPDAINLDASANGLLFSDGTSAADGTASNVDDNALLSFKQWGEEYAKQLFYQSAEYLNYLAAKADWDNEYEEAVMNAITPPAPITEVVFDPADYPQYCDDSTVKSYITKTMYITIRQTSQNSSVYDTIDYKIGYFCNWPVGSSIESSIEYPVSSVIYLNPVENIYLFYKPSVFKNSLLLHPDLINIDNQIDGKEINFFLAQQTPAGGTLLPDVTITEGTGDGVTVFTNLNSVYVKLDGGFDLTDSINSQIVNTEQKDRIYDTEIELYKHVESTNIDDKFKKLVYTLTSATENSGTD